MKNMDTRGQSFSKYAKKYKQEMTKDASIPVDCKSATSSVNYRQLCFTTYERQLTELCRDFVEETCDKSGD